MDSRRGLCLGLLIAALALPQAAQAAVRCVPAIGPGCTTSHATINAAVTAAANDDTIKIAAGTYPEAVSTIKRLNFVGAGSGTLDSPAGATVIAPASGAAFTLLRGGSLRSLRALGASGFIGSSGLALQPDVDGSFAYTVSDVIALGGTGNDITIGTGGAGMYTYSASVTRTVNLTVSGSSFRGGASLSFFPGTGMSLGGAGLTANLTGTSALGPSGGAGGTGLAGGSGASIQATGLTAQGTTAVSLGDATVTLRRSNLAGVYGGASFYDFNAATPTTINLIDSLVTVLSGPTGSTGLSLGTNSGGDPATVNVRGSTVVAGGPDPQYAVVSRPNSGAPPATINLRNSIARLLGPNESDEADVAADRGTVTAASSDFATRLQLNGGTVTAPGAGTNLTADPLFNAGAFSLQSGSPLIDRGDPALVTAGELDLAGNPRLAGAAPDMGAYEYQAPVAPPPPPPANSAPTLGKVSMTNTVFAPVAARSASAADTKRARARVKRGTRFRYLLSEASTVTITVERRVRGKRARARARGRCVKANRRNRKHKACTRWLRAGVLKAVEQAGSQGTPFGGRFKGRALKPGRYRARVYAKDASGARSSERRLSFRIVRAR